jgi:hypothetical protein
VLLLSLPSCALLCLCSTYFDEFEDDASVLTVTRFESKLVLLSVLFDHPRALMVFRRNMIAWASYMELPPVRTTVVDFGVFVIVTKITAVVLATPQRECPHFVTELFEAVAALISRIGPQSRVFAFVGRPRFGTEKIILSDRKRATTTDVEQVGVVRT